MRQRTLMLSLVLLALANITVWAISGKSSALTVSFLDVGQGDAALVTSPEGHRILIDAGPPDNAVLRALADEDSFQKQDIDVAIESHPDLDHIGGFPALIDRYRVGAFLASGVDSDNAYDEEIELRLQKKGIPAYQAVRGMELSFAGARLDFLFPDRDPKGMETNDASLIARLRYGSTCFLFTGDSPVKIERYLIGLEKEGLRCDVLKAGHHGSRGSTGEEFLHFIKPAFVVVSAGEGNRYGHPHEETLARIEAAGAEALRTDQIGTVSIVSNGESIEIKGRRSGLEKGVSGL
jgi:beta-lactamase superfamily II metal-dependent hydrolase